MDKPKLRTPIISAGLALIFWTVSVLAVSREVKSILYGFTLIAICTFLYAFVDHFTFYLARRIAQFKAAAENGTVAVLDKLNEYNAGIRAMDSDQLRYAQKLRPTLKIIPGFHTPPIKVLILEDGTEAGWDFVCEFFELSQGDYVIERRRWSEGSAWHIWADKLTLSLIRNGYAVDAIGNHSAKWVSARAHEEAEYSYGFRED